MKAGHYVVLVLLAVIPSFAVIGGNIIGDFVAILWGAIGWMIAISSVMWMDKQNRVEFEGKDLRESNGKTPKKEGLVERWQQDFESKLKEIEPNVALNTKETIEEPEEPIVKDKKIRNVPESTNRENNPFRRGA